MEELEAEAALRASWIELERAVGVSLWPMEKVEHAESTPRQEPQQTAALPENFEDPDQQVGLEPAPEPIAPEEVTPEPAATEVNVPANTALPTPLDPRPAPGE